MMMLTGISMHAGLSPAARQRKAPVTQPRFQGGGKDSAVPGQPVVGRNPFQREVLKSLTEKGLTLHVGPDDADNRNTEILYVAQGPQILNKIYVRLHEDDSMQEAAIKHGIDALPNLPPRTSPARRVVKEF